MPHYMGEEVRMMQNSNDMRERLMSEFADGYMEKIFYFCLKKTGNTAEAEDLSQDIALNIIAAIKGGTVPVSFNGWVWQIARNRYSGWAKAKHDHRAAVADNLPDEDIPDGETSVIDRMIHAEDVARLRRELAFIRSDFRRIITAYYIENRSIRDIAASLALSDATVKQRLFRGRQLLKEGMDMAREFGKLSYSPENIGFMMNGMVGKDGEPRSLISRLLCNNILLAAYRNPATAEELAIEVGVALPYMEEELSILTNATLMKKNGNKYETNFFIVSAEAQEKIFTHLRKIAPELTKAITAAVEYELRWRNENYPGWHEGYQSFEDIKWALLMIETDNVSSDTLKPYGENAATANIGPWGHTLRPNGGEWDILGMETYRGDIPGFVGLHGCVSSPDEKELPEIFFRQFKFGYHGLGNRTPDSLTYADGQALVAVAKGNVEDVDPVILSRLESYGYIKKTDEGYIPTIMVMFREKSPMMPAEARDEFEELRRKATDIATRHYLFCREQIYGEIPDFLKEDEFQIDHACANIFALRGAVLEEALRQGYLSFEENEGAGMLGAFLII